MFQKTFRTFVAVAGVAAAGLMAAETARAGQTLGAVFTIEMENHNLTQPGNQTSPNPLLGNPAAPYQMSLITPGNPNAAQTSWTNNYHNVAPGIHPSLPNYLWQEAGTNGGVLNDNTPFGNGGVNQGNRPSLSALLQNAGIPWKSYQEDIDTNAAGNVLPQSQWTVPLTNRSGVYTTTPNAYNGSLQYNFATKHDGQLYFNATNGGNDPSTSNPLIPHYAPLQQLQADLNNNTVGRYNLITPNQFNDSHTALSTNFNYAGQTWAAGTDENAIAVGDNFLSKLVPMIMASQAYKNNGAIVIWWDETEGGDDASRTLEEIVISPLAKGNAYLSTLNYTHSSDLKSLQELYGVSAPGGGFLGDANSPGTNDLADLFQADALSAVPEPSTWATMGVGLVAMLGLRFRRLLAANPA